MQIRGAGIRSLLQAVEKAHGADGLRKLKGAVPRRIHMQIESGVLPVAWYPVEVSSSLQVAIRDVFGNGKWDHAHKLGVVASKIDFTGVYRVLIRAVQYEAIWERSERAWPQYNSQGEAKWVERGERSATAVFRGVTGYNMGLWQSVAGRVEGLLQLAGCKAASVTVTDGTSTHGRVEAIWVP